MYNNVLVNSKNHIDSCFNLYGKQIDRCINDSLYDSIPRLTDDVLQSIQHQISYIKTIPVLPNGDKYMQSCIAYYESLSSIAKAYNRYTILNDEIVTCEQIDSIKVVINTSEKAVKTAVNNLISEQKEFAQVSKIKLN